MAIVERTRHPAASRAKPTDHDGDYKAALPNWERRVAWYLREKLAGHAPPIPWHWKTERGKLCCAVCFEGTVVGSFEDIPYCRAHEALALAEIEARL